MSQPDLTLINDDLAPTTPAQRTWTRWHIAALWVGMSVCIPTYMLASGLVDQGWGLSAAIVSVAIGNLVVLLPLVLNAHPGTRYGIPFPVLLRAPFGVLGSNVPAMLRALVACGWFGIQTWIGGSAIYALSVALLPDSWSLPQVMPGWLGIGTGELLSFLAFWAINVAIIIRGMDSVKVLETWAAPFLIFVGLALFGWAWWSVGDLGLMLSDPAPPTEGGLGALGVGITGAVAFWGTLALNIPDFARYAKNQQEQIVGQSIGLPPTMTLFAFIGAVVTNATVFIFGTRIADPVALLAKVGGPAVTVAAMFGLAIATLSTNLAANVVSPANDFSNLAPKRISFRTGALMTAGIGVAIMPWRLIADASQYLFTWLLGYGACLGAVGGIMIADYYLIRRCRLEVVDLYRRGGIYEYIGGVNPIAMVALFAGIAPNLPGFLGALGVTEVSGFWSGLYNWAWFVSFGLAATIHFVGMKLLARGHLARQLSVARW